MTRDEALEALELAPTATAADAERAYERLFNDFRIRIDNAPTPSLRATYRDRLARLDVARATLTGAAREETYGDLPASALVETPTAMPAPAAATVGGAMLLVRSTEACALLLDGEPAGVLEAGARLRLAVQPGMHEVAATADDGRRWSHELRVPAGEQVIVTVELPAVAAMPASSRVEAPSPAARVAPRSPVPAPAASAGPAPDLESRPDTTVATSAPAGAPRKGVLIAAVLVAVVAVGAYAAYAAGSRTSVADRIGQDASAAIAGGTSAVAPPTGDTALAGAHFSDSAPVLAGAATASAATARTRPAPARDTAPRARRVAEIPPARGSRTSAARLAELRAGYPTLGLAIKGDGEAPVGTLPEFRPGEQLDLVRWYLDAGISPHDTAGTRRTPLEEATARAEYRRPITRLLLDRGADPNRWVEAAPLCLAMHDYDGPTVQLLLDRGADVNRPSPRLWGPPIFCAVYGLRAVNAEYIRAQLLMLVARGASLTARNANGRTLVEDATNDDMRAVLRSIGAK